MSDFIAGAIGGAFGIMVGYPLDTVKVRIQTQKNYKGMWHCIYTTYKMEKMSGFFRGLSMSMSTVSICSSISFGTYKSCLHALCKLRYGSAEVKPSNLDIFLSGYAAGAVRVLVTSPTDMAKVRLQTQMQSYSAVASSCLLSKPKYQGPVHCLRMVVQEEGFLGLYRGCLALMFRDCLSFATYFLSYAVLREWLAPAGQSKPETLGVLLSGGFAGMLAWTVATPMDVIKSRLQVNGASIPKYRGVIHCITTSVRQEGVKVLFKGLGLNCLRAFPVNMVVFLTYESILTLTKQLSI
ncbi:solute carrier family 25 member 47 [Microcaecilia unicolor]|uniref:Solute carrier family 25 member 47 n=1 Tax=Microcaecilia unicolor TaxID=1415580 RepID=A0A6P7Z5F9_9AMPH|nr:solute carrier family 25 member 47 [Microcaecilia unicolor]